MYKSLLNRQVSHVYDEHKEYVDHIHSCFQFWYKANWGEPFDGFSRDLIQKQCN